MVLLFTLLALPNKFCNASELYKTNKKPVDWSHEKTFNPKTWPNLSLQVHFS